MSVIYNYTGEYVHIHHAVDPQPKNDDYPMHVHDNYEILYFVNGNVAYLVEGSEYPLTPGSLVIMRPSESHKVKILGERMYERYSLGFDPSMLAIVDPERRLLTPFLDHPLGQNNFYPPSVFQNEDIGELFKSMCVPAEDDRERRLAIMIPLYRLLSMIRRAFLENGGTDPAMLQDNAGPAEKIVAYINKYLFDDLSLDKLSEQFFLSTSQISRLFKQATGSSVWEYITIKRLIEARRKIREGKSPSDVCSACGFRDYSTFFRAYVKRFGVSPKNDAAHNQAGVPCADLQ